MCVSGRTCLLKWVKLSLHLPGFHVGFLFGGEGE